MAGITARRWLCLGLSTVGATLLATTASAQPSDTAVRIPAWDATGTVAVHSIRASELYDAGDGYYDYWEGQWQPGVQVGRYLTAHVKAEIGLRGPTHYTFYESDSVSVPGLPPGLGFADVDRNIRVFSVAPAITWQFFENSFVHPYVSAGVAMDISDIHRFREAGTRSIVYSRTTVRYDVTGIDTHETAVEARPFFAAGTKSYFGNGRWFVRPEIEMGVTHARIGAVSLRLGVGVDF